MAECPMCAARRRAELERLVAVLYWRDSERVLAARRAVLASWESMPKVARFGRPL